MSGKKQREGGILSTPRKGNSSSSEDIIGQTASTLSQQPSFTPANLLLGPQPPVRCDMGLPLSPYREPPPSYQTAMAYPDTSEPYLTNSDVITFSKPHGAVPPYPSLSVSNQMFLPTSPSLLASVSSQHSRAVISRSRHCPHCGIGILSGQTDLFCLICLILLAVCTFPVGLLFLCFIPCTVHRRCNHCRSIG
ncbi:Protein transport protein [Dirofilaria immitis]